ncbi:MAG: hypothetical protein LBR10_10235, partial [Prevotellaceae bacterium]|nr:hypothetical protein [Prevotellaceae bacterium]
DGKQHFILKDKFVDVFYEVKIPLTFGAGTRIVRTDTMDFDLSGDDFINNLDELRIWIDCKNRFRAAVDLEVLFLDEYKREIPSIQRGFTINPATPAGGANQRDAQPSEGTFEIKFNSNEIDDAKRTSYVALKYVLKTDQNSGDVNIHPSDYISLKLDAYATINLEF